MSSSHSGFQIEDATDIPAEPGSDAGAQKRLAIGLAARRPTATTAVQRPPSEDTSRPLVWTLAFLLGSVLVVTAMLVIAGLATFPDDWLNPSGGSAATGAGQSKDSRIFVAGSVGKSSTIPADSRPGQWIMGPNPSEGTYDILVWPNHAGWATLGIKSADAYRVQAQFMIAAGTPWGYGGLIVRFNDDRNFYQFLVDGEGRYQVQQQVDGQFDTMQPWTLAPEIVLAGNANTITVEDDGATLFFWGNDALLYSTPAGQLPSADVGIVGGATQEGAASISFESVQLWPSQ